MSNKLTNENFIQRAKKIHNDKYDYSNIKYVDYHTPVLINCFGGRKKLLIQKHHDWLKRKYAQKNSYNLLIIPYWEKDNIEKILLETLS